jgi:hypothetical protein
MIDLATIRPGQTVRVVHDTFCMKPGELKVVKRNDAGDLYVECMGSEDAAGTEPPGQHCFHADMVDELELVTFSAAQICEALAIPRGTLYSWTHSEYLKGLESPPTRAGKARVFTFNDAAFIAIFSQLMRIGLAPKDAVLFAESGCTQLDNKFESTLVIEIFDDGRRDFRLHHNDSPTPLDPAAVLSMHLNLGAIIWKLQRLAEAHPAAITSATAVTP